MRVAMVCPYSFDAPGGVQAHVVDLARSLRGRGHRVRVLAPGTPGEHDDPDLTLTGPGVAIPYNGSVARLSFGAPTWSATRRWLRAEPVDVLHLHEPNAPSLSMIAMGLSQGPIAATFHTSTARSRVLEAFEWVLAPQLEKIRGRIAVSSPARRWQIEALGSDAVEIPNGLDVGFYRRAAREVAAAGGGPGAADGPPTIAFLGRYDESRKGMDVLAAALPEVLEHVPGLRLRIMGDGDAGALRARLPAGVAVDFLGRVDDERKARELAGATVYCAPNTGGESFGIVLTEAMASGTPVVASDLDAFRRVLRGGELGALFATGDPRSLARVLIEVLGDAGRRRELVERADEAVCEYDWSVVAERVVRVYETIRGPGEELRVR